MRNPSLFFVLTYLPITALAQHQLPPPPRADLIILDMQPGRQVDISSAPGIRRYRGNVRLRQQTMVLFCDRAIHQLATNTVSAAGHVLLVQNDSLTVKGDSLFYDAPTQQAVLTGHVLLQNGRSVLTASQLYYNLLTGTAQYTGKGRLANGRSILTVTDGFYDLHTKQLAAAMTSRELPRSHVPDQPVPVQGISARIAPQQPEAERPVRLTMSPQPNNIVTKPESVGTYKRQVRVSERPLETATGAREPAPDESDLEHILNRKKRAF
ncbi:OstA-like protein [Fibrella forsythiae]|uniref:Organic solvent tolerance-like N-terminal domain-containing protein n=1 Tax=Fibrella forsythiae TaxID=2817061 RepID=A0ABS3JH73_9BACT|nr:OstA-like protein [Fibrella forsythiae]MBO0948242.1 hypothetical protein [Fibrella forsythiae]